MKNFIKYALLVIYIVSLVLGLVFVVFDLYCEFFGYDKGNNLLKSINSPLNDNGIILVGFICCVILILSTLVRKKFFS
ncbi:hypothetical protein EOM82_05515 [bacterium]|nr:hypothetical protein [bacterium]